MNRTEFNANGATFAPFLGDHDHPFEAPFALHGIPPYVMDVLWITCLVYSMAHGSPNETVE
jgi:hypothetical protein